jgi:hypothetical protein
MKSFLQRFAGKIKGVLSGFDRLRFRGTKRWLACGAGVVAYLRQLGVPLGEFGSFVEEQTKILCSEVRKQTAAAGRPLVYVRDAGENKEERVREIAVRDGIQEGLVAVLSCVEPCFSYVLLRNPESDKPFLVRRERKCLHYYHYYIHPELGWLHTRLQTWLPYSVHVCLNGREWLSRQLDKAGVGSVRQGNCLVAVEDYAQAQALFDEQLRTHWTKLLDGIVAPSNPVEKEVLGGLKVPYYWSVDESEWATDIVFAKASDLRELHPRFVRHGIEVLQSQDVLRFLGQRLTGAGEIPGWYHGDVRTDVKGWTEGTRIRHRANRNGLKAYDKAYTPVGAVLRIEATVNNVRDFKVYRGKEGNAQGAKAWLPLRKGVADLHRRAEVSRRATERYADSLATITDKTPLGEIAEKLSQPVQWKGKRVRALNLFAPEDMALLEVVSRGEHLLNGFRNRDLRAILYPTEAASPQEAKRRSAAVTRKLRLLRAQGLIEKISKTHRYKLSKAGGSALTAILTARQADTAKLATAA